MSLWTSLEPASATVDPGSATTVRLRLRNTGDVVDEYRFEAVGDIAPWTTVEPPTLRLFPGTTGTVELKFAPPRTPDATAGPNPYAIRITPTEHPEATTVPEGNLTITPFTELRAELVPPTVKGRFRGRPRLAVDNLGNTKLTASLSGTDNGDQLTYDLRPSNIQIEPGHAAFITTTLKPRTIIWFGGKEQRPYTLTVQRSGTTPLPIDGTFAQKGFLPRWLATFLGVLLALTITFIALWFGHKPAVATGTHEKLVEAGATLAPTPTPQATLAPPPATTAPTTPAQPTEATDSDNGSGGSGGGDSGPKRPEVPDPIGQWLIRPGALGKDETGAHPLNVTDVTGTDGHGGAGAFNGSSSQMISTSSVVPTGPGSSFTVSAWVYLNSTADFSTAVSQSGQHNSAFYLQFSPGEKRWSFARTRSDGGTYAATGYRALSLAPSVLHTWTHLVGVYDGVTGNQTLYVDGAPQGSVQDPYPFTTTGAFIIGRARYADANADQFDGRINEVAVWDQALTREQIGEIG
ncbi:LamG domain-containing protein [Streptomyces sp. NBC_00247]|uniref:LamG domain-containing protein n=1 Tax=Streptomyces sp. NBC_00247 TaxID=2975689 RepID=UPI002E290ADE|nr:LamG domain-containing protein [Streptomyces sp. NBC_00247]